MQANQDSPYTSMHLRTSRKSAARTCFLDHYTARTQSINFLYATTSKSFPDTFYLYKMYVQKIIHSAVLPLMNRREIFLAGPLQTLIEMIPWKNFTTECCNRIYGSWCAVVTRVTGSEKIGNFFYCENAFKTNN